MVDEVLALVGEMQSRDDILIDLEFTKSAEATVNRIFDGVFLTGTRKDPSLSIVRLEREKSMLYEQHDGDVGEGFGGIGCGGGGGREGLNGYGGGLVGQVLR
jgi:hypothetical protein